MKILVIGSGGREHALCWRLAQQADTVICAPGNAGIASDFEVVNVQAGDLDALEELALARSVDLVVVGPEAPLVAGLADRLRGVGVAVFGPGEKGARLEASKSFCKEFFERHGIPTAGHFVCETMAEVRSAIDRLGGDVVVKADGLAGGKGVVICSTEEEALAASKEMIEERRFGEASAKIVIEERLRGREVSMMAVTDGQSYRLLATAEDHKSVFDGDRGPNTGGMGAVSPCSWVSPEQIATIETEVFDRTVAGLLADEIDYRGVLYAGLMLTESGPKMLEYNVRFGDPETQVILPRLKGDFAELLLAAAKGALPSADLEWEVSSCVGVVLASAGYPESAEVGKVIHGLETPSDALLFHAGTRQEGGHIVTSGGRVLAVVALGDDLESAMAQAYAAVGRIEFAGVQFRRDIGARRAH